MSIYELCCSLFQAARQQFRSRTSLWDKLKGLFKEYFVVSWDTVWLAIIYGHKGGVLQEGDYNERCLLWLPGKAGVVFVVMILV